MTDNLDARLRGFREQEKLDATRTDEQKAIRDRRRKILGSLDDTYALNRAEAER